MSEICLRFDEKAEKEIEALKQYYKLPSVAATIKRSLTLLSVAKDIEEAHGKLIAQKDNYQRTIIVE